MEEYLSEKEQWERVVAWVREQGPSMLLTVAVVAAGFGGWRYWQAQREQHMLAAQALYEQALDAFSNDKASDGERLADQLVRDYPKSPYANQADLAAARVEVENKQLASAATRLARVLSATRDPQLALATRLRLARLQLAESKPDEALQTLNAVDPGAYAARYADVRGDILFSKGDREGALKAYRAARSSAGDTLDTGLLDLKIKELASS